MHIVHCETNKLESDFGTSQIIDCTFESSAFDTLPSNFLAQDFPSIIGQFIYDNYNIQNDGSGIEYWNANKIRYGMIGTFRYGIGYFYFYIPIPNPISPPPIIPSDTVRVNFPPQWLLNTQNASNTLNVPNDVVSQWLATRYGVR